MHKAPHGRLNLWVVLLSLIAIASTAYAIQMTRAQSQLNELKSVIALLPPVPQSFLENEYSVSKPEYVLTERTYSTYGSATVVKNYYRNEFNKRGYVFISERSESETGSFTLYYCNQSFDIEINYNSVQAVPATYTVILAVRPGLQISLAKGVKLGSGCSGAKAAMPQATRI